MVWMASSHSGVDALPSMSPRLYTNFLLVLSFLITFTLRDEHVCGFECHRGHVEVKRQLVTSPISPCIMVGARDGPQVIRLGGERLYPLSHLSQSPFLVQLLDSWERSTLSQFPSAFVGPAPWSFHLAGPSSLCTV